MSKTGVKYLNKKFFYDEEKKVVVCNLQYEVENNYFGTMGFYSSTGVAKCKDGDEFNKEIGRRIALTRAQSKAFKTASKLYKELYNDRIKEADKMYRLFMNNWDSEQDCKKHVNDILDHYYDNMKK